MVAGFSLSLILTPQKVPGLCFRLVIASEEMGKGRMGEDAVDDGHTEEKRKAFREPLIVCGRQQD
jgi:hypothetical protein